MATQQMTASQANQVFLDSSLVRNYVMASSQINAASGTLDIELDSVPGWASAIDLAVVVALQVTVASGGSTPRWSAFAPHNIFQDLQVSLGGGPFQRTSPVFHALRERISSPGWRQGFGGPDAQPYVSAAEYELDPITAAAGGSEKVTARFVIHVPLQVHHDSVIGLLPLGNGAVRAKLRLTLAQLYGSDEFLSPVVGGSQVTVTLDPTVASTVTPVIWYRTTPAIGGQLPVPAIQYILNVQQRVSSLVGTGVLTPIRFTDPFRYLRLWHVVIDGTGAPDTESVYAFELDLTPGYPSINYSNAAAMQVYFARTARLYRQDLPTGVFVHDLFSGSDPANPNGNQVIDGTVFATLQTQIGVTEQFATGSAAKIVTFAEALSPVQF